MDHKFSKLIVSFLFVCFLLAPPIPFPEAQEQDSETDQSQTLPSPFGTTEVERNMVEVPEPEEHEFNDAGDFRDPFFLIRGYQDKSKAALTPGSTIDGVRFNSYANSSEHIKNFYKNSNFTLKDVYGKIVPLENENIKTGCLLCHRGIEEISANHRFPCTQCHSGNKKAKTIEKAHKGMVSNPSDLKYAKKYCGKCHMSHIKKVQDSLMATTNGLVNATRFAWGEKPIKGLPHSLKNRGKNSKEPAVNDFLRKKCMRCHLQGTAPNRPGDYRATGCAACHMVYANDGLSLTHDRAIRNVTNKELKKNKERFNLKFAANALNNKRGYPLLHKFTVAIPSVQCEHCHNNNGVGNEFEGIFGKPARPKPSMQEQDADQPVLYGRQHDFLLQDIHRERGMHCIDCHDADEMKSGNPKSQSMHSLVQTRCKDCHGTHGRAPEGFLLVEADPKAQGILEKNKLNPNLEKKVKFGDMVLVTSKGRILPHIKKANKKWVLFSKVTGKKHVIPILKDLPPPLQHRMGKHMASIECATCHARWSANEWGLHTILENEPDLDHWKDWSFPGPTVQQKLFYPPETNKKGMLDWLSARPGKSGIQGRWSEGTWWNVFTESDWNSMILGVNARGKYTILKPRHQYFITEKEEQGESPKKRAMVPFSAENTPGFLMTPHTPHTIRKTARTCESCHENSVSAGLGEPSLENITDAQKFLSKLKSTNRIASGFQIKQLLTKTGGPLQSTYPYHKTRFLRAKEIKSLQAKSKTYKGFRYKDLRGRNFPRLLVRDVFPYDAEHRLNEQKFDLPPEEDLFYDLNLNRFSTYEQREPEPSEPEPQEMDTEDSPTDKPTPPIYEFLRGLFKPKPNPEKP